MTSKRKKAKPQSYSLLPSVFQLQIFLIITINVFGITNSIESSYLKGSHEVSKSVSKNIFLKKQNAKC